MRSKNPELMKKILKYAEQYYLDFGHSPTTLNIAKALDIAKSTVYRYLLEMNDKGMLEYDGQEIQTAVTRKVNQDISQTAIVGSIPCGTPEYEEEHIEGYVALPTAIFGKEDLYILRANGESMIDAGIDDGDLVVIKKNKKANDGDIVVALVDNQNTLKRFYRDDENRKWLRMWRR
jgi:repressor LexA